MNKRQEKVKQFFDGLADTYAARFSAKKPYHQHFFQERLRLATQDFDFNQKSILDIGAGTGSLYNFIKAKFPDFQYYATDISAKMLENSNIPSGNYFVGNATEIQFPTSSFDFIFLLGVTTYMEQMEFEQTLSFIAKQLKKDGVAIISFTNRNSYDFKIRRILNFLLKKTNKRRNVLNADFEINAFQLDTLKSNLPTNLILHNFQYFNHTITPFNHLFPNLSVHFDKWLKNRRLSPTLLSRFSSDFLIHLKLK